MNCVINNFYSAREKKNNNGLAVEDEKWKQKKLNFNVPHRERLGDEPMLPKLIISDETERNTFHNLKYFLESKKKKSFEIMNEHANSVVCQSHGQVCLTLKKIKWNFDTKKKPATMIQRDKSADNRRENKKKSPHNSKIIQ